jgi:hypothetical protein
MQILCFDIGTKTLSYCLLEMLRIEGEPPALTIHEWESIDVHAEANLVDKAKPTMREDCEMVINSIDARIDKLWGYELDNVIVEQQPAGGKNMFSSVRMKVVSHALHAYFYSQQLRQDRRVPVTFVSPSSKLVGLDFNESEEAVAARQAGGRKAMGAKYRANKRHAVEMTAKLLETMQGAAAYRARVTFAAATPKQDDISDAFMLAFAFGTKAFAQCTKVESRKRRRLNVT